MKSQRLCKLCNRPLAKVHEYQQAEVLHDHIKREHPEAYQRLSEMNETQRRLEEESREKFGVWSRDWFYYG